jgi:hypothetical protein
MSSQRVLKQDNRLKIQKIILYDIQQSSLVTPQFLTTKNSIIDILYIFVLRRTKWLKLYSRTSKQFNIANTKLTLVAEPQVSTQLIPDLASGHDPEPAPSTSYSHNLFP